MNYELAKELKDAEFPQYGDGYFAREHGDAQLRSMGRAYVSSDCPNALQTALNTSEEVVFFPTLSELIEACGERFGSVGKNSLDVNDYVWEAWDNDCYVDFGDTPEEAVARLWLALNKKS